MLPIFKIIGTTVPYYEEQFIKHKQNTKMIWKTINELLNKPTRKKELPKEFLLSNSSSTTSNPIEIANKFNDYFVNLGPKLAKQIKTGFCQTPHMNSILQTKT